MFLKKRDQAIILKQKKIMKQNNFFSEMVYFVFNNKISITTITLCGCVNKTIFQSSRRRTLNTLGLITVNHL